MKMEILRSPKPGQISDGKSYPGGVFFSRGRCSMPQQVDLPSLTSADAGPHVLWSRRSHLPRG